MTWDIGLHLASVIIEGFGLVILVFKAGAFVNEMRSLKADHDEHVAADKEEFARGRRTMQWFGDCITTLGVKLNVRLPERPE